MKKSKKTLIVSLSVGAALLVALAAVLIYFGITDIVTFDLDGGTMDTTQVRVMQGKEYSLPTPTKDGYAFAGWYFGETLVSMTGKWQYHEDIMLKAKWEIFDELGFIYKKVENGYVIEEYRGEAKELIIVPKTYNNSPIVSIDEKAFKHLEASIPKSPNGYIKVLVPSTAVSNEDLVRFGQKLMINRYSAVGENGLIYLENNNDVSVVGFNGSYSTDIVIPETFNSKPVKTIGSYTFFGSLNHLDSNRAEFLKVLIPLNVENVGYGAFAYCRGMKALLYRMVDGMPVEIVQPDIADYTARLDWLLKAKISEGNDNLVQLICVTSSSFGWSEYSNATYFVRFNGDGGYVDKSYMILKKKGKYSLPTPVREGYTFDGWYNGETLVPQEGEKWGFKTFVELTAKWTEIQG
ncbi:MAG: InlB B-repeat-containing protein [Clostridia bacterium]|nr:InlB B-repeat-containing protein [Clostridia bacterium]